MADRTRNPLVTFYVMAFNQQRFIREAVEGALRQNYSPLEIVLSDDCSTDNTFTIIQEVVKEYSGPHRIIVNRNDRNLGVSDHLNRIVELATGELIVAADGDDVSRPERTARCVEVWLKHGQPAALVTGVCCIGATGDPSQTKDDRWFAKFLPVKHETREANLVRFSKQDVPRLISCSGTWTREMWEAFGPLPPGIWIEDSVISLRAWLFDRIVYVPDALVDYREHDSNICNRVRTPLDTPHARRQAEDDTRTDARRTRESLMSYGPDLDLALQRRWITRPIYEEVRRQIKHRCAVGQVIETWWTVCWLKRFGQFLRMVGCGRLLEARWCAPRLLPFQIFIAMSALWSRGRILWKKSMAYAITSRPSSLAWIYPVIDSCTSCLGA